MFEFLAATPSKMKMEFGVWLKGALGLDWARNFEIIRNHPLMLKNYKTKVGFLFDVWGGVVRSKF